MKTIQTITLVSLLALASVSNACSCIFANIKNAYFSPQVERFVRATPISKGTLNSQVFDNVYYVLKIEKDYKGCKRTSTVFVRTSGSSASCGISLTLNKSYVLPLSSGLFPRINLCQFIRQYDSLSNSDVAFLNGRQLCCKGSCTCANGENPVQCFVDPCSVSKPPCPEAVKCVSNFCGGCFAEWFTKDGSAACQSGISGISRTDVTSE